MAKQTASAKRAEKSVKTPTKKRKGTPQTNQNSLANLRPPWQPGQPSPNPGGRPKLLGESYKQWLEKFNESADMTNAEAVAMAMGVQAIKGDVSAAKEIRTATEGNKIEITDWEVRVIQAIKAGEVDYESVVEEFGPALANDLYKKAGVSVPASD